jgi:tRNA(Ile)-lysidine synthase
LDCAVSGGADSLALLALAAATGRPTVAYHVDHGLRPGSAAEAAVVAAAAARFGAGFVGVRVEVGAGPNLEARARRARLAALPAGSLTGHTADDQAETVLVNLLRGAGLDGLAAMRPLGDGPRLGHPLLAVRRSETHDLCQRLGLDVVVDPSNDDPRFVRNRVRHELLPLLADIARRDPVPILARQAELLADDADLLGHLVDAVDAEDAKGLREAPIALARRAVRGWLAGLDAEGHPPDAATVERVLAVARQDTVACEIGGGRRVGRTAGRLRVEPVRDPLR